MGVPKFYRWLSERYPKINQVITDTALLPEFDHLYLDMNGILHGCSHPTHLDVSDRLSEREMIMGIMHYIDRIVTQIVKPKVSVFMAIDGVAPRAKLNQQRSRRFRSAKELANATKEKELLHDPSKDDEGGTSPYGGAFDSNCITPGTEFMARVSEAIKYFIRKKIKEDPLWRNLKIIFSGHEVPGEGEHKIMQHIREMKSDPNYKPNTRHCMYGQDADLIMLGLVSHEPHFTLLREIIDFGMGMENKNALKAVKKFTKQSDFQLLHLSILREYLDYEFGYGLEHGSYNLERIIDDFVFMTFLVGNDFLPHLPTLDIGDGAFELLFDTYREQRPTWGKGEYLVNTGEFSDAARLEKFLSAIGTEETSILEKREENEAVYRKKKRNWDKRDSKVSDLPSEAELALQDETKQSDYLSMLESIMDKSKAGNVIFVEGWSPPLITTNSKGVVTCEKDYKGRYYYETLQLRPIDIDGHNALRKAYIEGLMWCLAYYYRGCISWGWFFPYHYGPMLSDLTNLPEVMSQIHFEVGEPLKPFEQLMGCLPPASAALVPAPYRKLMSSPVSPINHFYPTDFKIDMDGKKNSWEGVNLLVFIDVQLLKDTIQKFCPEKNLTADELARNTFGKVFLYTHDFTATETVRSFNRELGFPDISMSNSRVAVLPQTDRLDIPFRSELVPGTIIPCPGYPSLRVLPIASVERSPIGLNCFGMTSKYPNFVLNLVELPQQIPGAEELAERVLGKHLFINYPMMHEAKVVAISDKNCEVRIVKKKKVVKKFSGKEADQWTLESSKVREQYFRGAGVIGSGGVNIGEIRCRLRLKPLQGMKVSPADGSSKKVFGNEEADIPLQMALWNSPAPDPRFVERGPMNLQDLYPAGCRVLLTKGKYKGCVGSVLGVSEEGVDQKVLTKVSIVPPEPPFGLAIARSVKESYLSSADAANVLKLRPQTIGKIMGSLLVDPGRYDLGLNLRYKKDFCLIGYTRLIEQSDAKEKKGQTAWKPGDSVRVFGSHLLPASENGNGYEEDRGVWEYTAQAVRLLAVYRQKFPQLFAAINKYPNERKYDAVQLFGPKGEEMLPKVREWLDSLETAKLPRTPTTTNAMPLSAIAAVQRAAEVRVASLEQAGPLKEVTLLLPPSALFREGARSATDIQPLEGVSVPQLGDRIANVCANGVPFGARGTVVSVHSSVHGCVEVVMDEEFIGGSNLQGSCKNFRGKLCLWSHLLKISATDSADIVEQMIPAKTTPMEKVKALKTTQHPEQLTVQKSVDEHAKAAASESENSRSQPIEAKTPTGAKAAASQPVEADRSKTPTEGKKKQGAWRDAKGPQQDGKGFKGAKRGGKSGYTAWKQYVSKSGAVSSSNGSVKETVELSNEVGSGSKAPPRPEQQPWTKINVADATAGLKAVLGVAATPAKVNVATPSTAADALMALMIDDAKHPAAVPVQANAQKFNFTYIQEGKEEQQAAAPKNRVQDPQLVGTTPPIATAVYPVAHHPMMPFLPHVPGFMAYPMPHAYHAAHPVIPSASIVPRIKKLGGNKVHSDAKTDIQMVPSVVASKAKK